MITLQNFIKTNGGYILWLTMEENDTADMLPNAQHPFSPEFYPVSVDYGVPVDGSTARCEDTGMGYIYADGAWSVASKTLKLGNVFVGENGTYKPEDYDVDAFSSFGSYVSYVTPDVGDYCGYSYDQSEEAVKQYLVLNKQFGASWLEGYNKIVLTGLDEGTLFGIPRTYTEDATRWNQPEEGLEQYGILCPNGWQPVTDAIVVTTVQKKYVYSTTKQALEGNASIKKIYTGKNYGGVPFYIGEYDGDGETFNGTTRGVTFDDIIKVLGVTTQMTEENTTLTVENIKNKFFSGNLQYDTQYPETNGIRLMDLSVDLGNPSATNSTLCIFIKDKDLNLEVGTVEKTEPLTGEAYVYYLKQPAEASWDTYNAQFPNAPIIIKK